MNIVKVEIALIVIIAIALGMSIAILDWVWIIINCFILGLWVKSLVDEIKGINRVMDVMKDCLNEVENKLYEIYKETPADSERVSQKD